MKITSILAPFLAAVVIVDAKALLAVFEDKVIEGQTYRVKWINDRKATLELLLVQKTETGWTQIDTLFQDRVAYPGDGHYDWYVKTTYPVGHGYGLWLSSDYGNNKGYADLSSWFRIKGRPNAPPAVRAVEFEA